MLPSMRSTSYDAAGDSVAVTGRRSAGLDRHGAGRGAADDSPRVTVLCAAGLAPMMEELKTVFEQHNQCIVDITYKGSAELVALHQIQKAGDVLIAADTDYHLPLVENGLCDPPVTIGFQFPCLIANTEIVADVTPEVLRTNQYRTSIPKRDHAAIGRAVAAIVGNDTYDAYIDSATVSRETVSQVASDVDQQIADVGVAWNTTAAAFNRTRTIVVASWKDARSTIGASLLSSSTEKKAAVAFIDFLGSSIAKPIVEKFGYVEHAR